MGGLYFIVICVGVLILMFGAHHMGKHPGYIFLLAAGGFLGSFFIFPLLGIYGATAQGVFVMMILTFVPSCVMEGKWAGEYAKEVRIQKLLSLKDSLIEDYDERRETLRAEKSQMEGKLGLTERRHNLLMLLQFCASSDLKFYENHRLSTERENRNELLKKIEDKECEISAIDKQIADIRANNDYKQLLKMKRGEKK